MGWDKKVKVEDIEPLVHEYKGNVAAIARKFGVSRGTIWNRVQESSTLRAAFEDARESMIDNAESTLYKEVLDGNMTAIIFFLKTQGRQRGYIERQEVDNSGEMMIRVKYENEND
jgi:hypothetical protein